MADRKLSTRDRESTRGSAASCAHAARTGAREASCADFGVGFWGFTQNRSSLEDAPPRAVAIELRLGAGFRHEKPADALDGPAPEAQLVQPKSRGTSFKTRQVRRAVHPS